MSRQLKKKGKADTIKRENLLTMLRQCYLGGALKECILNIEEGIGTIKAIDITNTITIFIKGNIGKTIGKTIDTELGLGNLELLIGFLASMEDNKVLISIDSQGNHLELKREDKQRKLKYLLTIPDVIVTRMEKKKKSPFEALEKKMEYEIELNKKTIRDFLSYSGMLKEKNTIIRLSEIEGGKRLSIIYGNTTEHQFEIVLNDNFKDSEDDEFDININGEFIAKIFNVIDYDEDDAPTLAFTNSEMPVLIKDKDTLWFITPITEVPF